MKKASLFLAAAIAFATSAFAGTIIQGPEALATHLSEKASARSKTPAVTGSSTAAADDEVCMATNVGTAANIKGSPTILLIPTSCISTYVTIAWETMVEHPTLTPSGQRIFLVTLPNGETARQVTWNVPRLDREVGVYSVKPVTMRIGNDVLSTYARDSYLVTATVVGVNAYSVKKSSTCGISGCQTTNSQVDEYFAILDRQVNAYRGSPVYDDEKYLIGTIYANGELTVVMTYSTIVRELEGAGLVLEGSGKG